MGDRIAIFIFRVRRKLGRELRQRTAGIHGGWDRMRMRSALADRDPRTLLRDFGKLAPWEDGVVVTPPINEWADPEEAAAIVAQADRACAHEFDLLGSGKVHLGTDIDWHLDFKSGYRWPRDVHHLRIRWDRLPAGTDIKVPWELSRCMHFATFGFADWITGDQKYYREFKEQVKSWIAANPHDRGVNWVCTMDVAIRAVNWLNAVMMFRHRVAEDDDGEFFKMLVESLWLHGRHIAGNLEWLGPRSVGLANHFLADITGLLALGVLFKGSRESARYRAFAMKWLEVEIRRQVFEDGAVFETSTSYHRLSFEMFLWADTLATRFGEGFSRAYGDRLCGMAVFVRAYMSPSGVAAQFGDNDSGRLLAAGIDQGGDHRYLTAGERGFGGRMNRLLLRGRSEPPVVDRRGAAEFPDGGYWFLRSGDAWMGVRAGVVSHRGAHAHCDQLSFVLAVGDEDFIIDPGTGVYSPDPGKRNRYRSSGAHNACRINGWESNSFRDDKVGLFQLGDDTETEVLDRQGDEGGAFMAGRHHGYERFRKGLIYERSLALRPGYLEIRDRFELLESGDRLDWSFHFAPGVELAREGDSVLACLGARRIRIIPDSRIEVGIDNAYHSPAYGVELRTVKLVLEALVSEPGDGDHEIRIEWAPVRVGTDEWRSFRSTSDPIE